MCVNGTLWDTPWHPEILFIRLTRLPPFLLLLFCAFCLVLNGGNDSSLTRDGSWLPQAGDADNVSKTVLFPVHVIFVILTNRLLLKSIIASKIIGAA